MENTISILLGVAVLLPLGAFFVNLLAGHALRKKNLQSCGCQYFHECNRHFGSAVIYFTWCFGCRGDNPSGKSNIQVLAELKNSNQEHLKHLNAGHHEDHVEHGEAEHNEHQGDESDHDHDSTALNTTVSNNSELFVVHEDSEASHGTGETEDSHAQHAGGSHQGPQFEAISGVYYTLGKFGSLALTIGYYIDSLTLAMFCMVTLIASLIHLYAYKYMDDELPISQAWSCR